MATLEIMYPAQANTPENSTAASISETDTHITVLNGAVLPDAPNILVLGADTEYAETVLMVAKSNNTITVQRGYDGTLSRPWPEGTLLGRFFCAADQNTIQENIRTVNSDLEKKASRSRTIMVNIPCATWINQENTVDVAGLSEDDNGFIGCPNQLSDNQLHAVILAGITVSGQGEGSITLKASGEIPEIDIPAVITIIG